MLAEEAAVMAVGLENTAMFGLTGEPLVVTVPAPLGEPHPVPSPLTYCPLVQLVTVTALGRTNPAAAADKFMLYVGVKSADLAVTKVNVQTGDCAVFVHSFFQLKSTISEAEFVRDQTLAL
jgi:hypothetical protein